MCRLLFSPILPSPPYLQAALRRLTIMVQIPFMKMLSRASNNRVQQYDSILCEDHSQIDSRQGSRLRRGFTRARESILPPILLTMDTIYDSADICPPLKSLVGGLRSIVNLTMVSTIHVYDKSPLTTSNSAFRAL